MTAAELKDLTCAALMIVMSFILLNNRDKRNR